MQGADGTVAVADLGGSIITGIDGNPLAVLARQLNIPMHDIAGIDVPLYLRDGSQLDATIDQQVSSTMCCCWSTAFLPSHPSARACGGHNLLHT